MILVQRMQFIRCILDSDRDSSRSRRGVSHHFLTGGPPGTTGQMFALGTKLFRNIVLSGAIFWFFGGPARENTKFPKTPNSTKLRPKQRTEREKRGPNDRHS